MSSKSGTSVAAFGESRVENGLRQGIVGMEGGWEGRELRDSRILDLLEPNLLSTLAADSIFAFVASERGKIYGGDY